MRLPLSKLMPWCWIKRIGTRARGIALALALLAGAGGRAEAQWFPGYAGYGYGWGMGMTLEDQLTLKAQIYALNESQVELNLSQARMALAAAARVSMPYEVRATSCSCANGDASWAERPLLPAELITRDGRVLWPKWAFRDRDLARDRRAAELAIAAVCRRYAATGRADADSVATARAALVAYGRPLLRRLRVRDQRASRGCYAFLSGLDAALRNMAFGPDLAAVAAGLEDDRPR